MKDAPSIIINATFGVALFVYYNSRVKGSVPLFSYRVPLVFLALFFSCSSLVLLLFFSRSPLFLPFLWLFLEVGLSEKRGDVLLGAKIRKSFQITK